MDSKQSPLINYQIILIFSGAYGKLVLFSAFFIIEHSVHKLADNEI